MLAPGALDDPVEVSLSPVTENDLTIPIPDGFEFAGGIEISADHVVLKEPAQLAVPVRGGISAGTDAWFYRETMLPGPTGQWEPFWVQVDHGIVDADGLAQDDIATVQRTE